MATRQAIIDSMTLNANKTAAGSIENLNDFGTQIEAFNYLFELSKWSNFRIDFLKYKTRAPFTDDGGTAAGSSEKTQFGFINPATVTTFSKSNKSESFGLELYARIMGIPEDVDLTKFGLVFKFESRRNFSGSNGATDFSLNRFSLKSKNLVYPNSVHGIDTEAAKPVSMSVKKFVGIALDGKWRNGQDELQAVNGMLPILLSDLTAGKYERILQFEPTTRGNYSGRNSFKIKLEPNKKIVSFFVHGKKIGQKKYYDKSFYSATGLPFKEKRISHKIPFKIQLVAKNEDRHNDIIIKDVFSGYLNFRGTAKFEKVAVDAAKARRKMYSINDNFSIDLIE